MEMARKAGNLKDATYWEDEARKAAKQGGFEAKLLTAGEKAGICQKDHDSNMEMARKAGNLKAATYWEDEARKAAKQGGFEAKLLTAGEKEGIC
jgi:hypothetical protein